MPDEKDRVLDVLAERLKREGKRREEVEAALNELEAQALKRDEERRRFEEKLQSLREELRSIRSAHRDKVQQLVATEAARRDKTAQLAEGQKARLQLEDELSRTKDKLKAREHMYGRMEHEHQLVKGELDTTNAVLARVKEEQDALQQRRKGQPLKPTPTLQERAERIESTVTVYARTAERVLRFAVSLAGVIAVWLLVFAPDRIDTILGLVEAVLASGDGFAIPIALLAAYTPKIIDAIRRLKNGSDE